MSDARGLLQELAIEMIREIRLHGSRKKPRFPGYSRFPEGLDCAPPFFQTSRILQDRAPQDQMVGGQTCSTHPPKDA